MLIFNKQDEENLENSVRERFLRYVRIGTASERHGKETPTSVGQWELARLLEAELHALGVEAELTAHCYVIARIPGNTAGAPPCIGFLAHLDTSGDVPGENVQPQFVPQYDGKPIALSYGIVLDPRSDAGLAAQKGLPIIHTDGTTLLGADDKAGIAEIMGAAEYLLRHPEIKHGEIEIIFSPDEETGKGLPQFPLEKIKSKACWTLDGGPLGEFEIECFNAYEAQVKFKGKAIHPGTARGVLVNAALMAAAFSRMLPRNESPEATDGYYGYYNLASISGNIEEAQVELLLRDFTREGIERRLAALDAFARAVEAEFPGGSVVVETSHTYENMRSQIEKRPETLEIMKEAAQNLGIPFKQKPIRGGTDGSRLSALGIPTPNIFTGGRNFHSRSEWAAVREMTTAAKLVLEIAALRGGRT